MIDEARGGAVMRQLSSSPSARQIWRAGELRSRALLPPLTKLTPRGDRVYDCSLAWALGRCAAAPPAAGAAADAAAAAALTACLWRLIDAADVPVSATAQAALLAAAAAERPALDAGAAETLIGGVYERLPAALRAALDAGEAGTLTAQLHGDPTHAFDVYLLGARRPHARRAALDFAAAAAFAPGPFAALRRLFKTAELVLDAELYGLLTRRIETTPAFYFRHEYPTAYQLLPGGRHVNFAAEMAGPVPALAYSNRTRTYLIRRAWRTLRRLGDAGDGAYVDLAVGQLLAVDDGLARPQRQADRYVFDIDGPNFRRRVRTSVYGDLSALWTFNHILYCHSARYRPSASGRGWEIRAAVDDAEPAQTAAFAPLWGQRPDALLTLLEHSRCAPVHRFAAAALEENTDACAALDVATLAVLLASRYPVTAALGLKLARARLDAGRDVDALLDALLSSSLADARALALDRFAADPSPLAGTARLARLLGSRYADVRERGRTLIARLDLEPARRDALIGRLLAELAASAADDDDEAGASADDAFAARVADIDAALHALFPERLREVGLTLIDELLAHPSAAVRVFAARLLANHVTPPELLPPGLLRRLLDSDNAELSALGVALFGRLPDATLREQHELLMTFCQMRHNAVRRAADAVVRRLCGDDTGFADATVRALLPLLYRREPDHAPGLHDDLLTLLTAPELAAALDRLDSEVLLRLLDARAGAAQRLGAHMLTRRAATTLRVARWARLADHPQLAARRWARQAYRDHPQRVKDAAADALRLLDSDWDDSRAFGFEYFAATFDPDDWTPELLIGVCDSGRDDVQRFGVELIERRLADDPADGVTYLGRLSQHPSARIQTLAADLLERFAAGRPALLVGLQRFFITALSQVNRGRVMRRRVQTFLHREALRDAASARVAAAVFGRQSATAVLADRAAYLQALRDIRERYPDIDTPLRIVAAEEQ